MTLNRDNVKTLDYVLEGHPFNESSATSQVTPSTLDFSVEGQPFNGNPPPSGSQVVQADDSTEVIDDLSVIGTVETDDSMEVLDETVLFSIVSPDDATEVIDELLVMGPPISPDDSTDVVDEMVGLAEFFADDETNTADELSVFALVLPDDETGVLDETSISIPFIADDELGVTDDLVAGALIEADDETGVDDSMTVRRSYQQSFSLEVQIRAMKLGSFSLEVGVPVYNAAASNQLLNPANGFNPTLILDGVTVVSNPETDPGALPAGVTSFAGFDLANIISGVDGCLLQDYNVSLQFGGGTFSIAHRGSKVFSEGQVIQVAGLPAVVTYEGPVSSPQLKGRRVQGIFGDQRKLNKQLLLVVQQNDPVLNLVPKTSFIGQPPSVLWQTVQTAAQAIANNAQISLSWMAGDVALMDAFIETGMKVGDAIRSLAGRIGGIFTWDGNNGWVVIDPISGFGSWSGFTESGCLTIKDVDQGNFLDLEGNEIIYIPIDNSYSSNVFFNAPTALQPPAKPLINHIYSTRTKLKNDSTGAPIPVYVDVPGDFNEVLHAVSTQSRLQIIVNPPDTGPANSTTDPNTWFPVHIPVETRDYGKKQFKITSDLLPGGLTNGKFQAVFGYVPDTSAKDAAFAQAVREQIERLKLLQQSQLERIRFFEHTVTAINGTFFGSLPIPGNITGGAYDGISWNGTVRSVTLSYPRNMTVVVSSMRKLNLATAKSTLDSFLANGGF